MRERPGHDFDDEPVAIDPYAEIKDWLSGAVEGDPRVVAISDLGIFHEALGKVEYAQTDDYTRTQSNVTLGIVRDRIQDRQVTMPGYRTSLLRARELIHPLFGIEEQALRRDFGNDAPIRAGKSVGENLQKIARDAVSVRRPH